MDRAAVPPALESIRPRVLPITKNREDSHYVVEREGTGNHFIFYYADDGLTGMYIHGGY